MAEEPETQAGIIRAVKGPLSFFTVVVLGVQTILGVVARQVDGTTAVAVICVMVALLVLVVVAVLIITIRGPTPTATAPGADSHAAVLTPQPAVAMPVNEQHDLSDYEVLKYKMIDYANKHRSSRLVEARGTRIIKKGDFAEHMFLLEEGNLIIDDETGRPEEEKELKHPGAIVGEAVVVSQTRRRTASVYVYSADARLVSMSRQAILDFSWADKDFGKALQYLVKLHASRLEKITLYCGPGVKTNTEQCTVLMGDIHGYTRLSEMVTDEMAVPFRFKFTEQSHEIATRNKGSFEDQGDGYKMFFRGQTHAERAMICALELKSHYAALVDEFARYDVTFEQFGLGMGLACEDFTVVTKPDGSERILGHSINIAAALCKLRDKPNETRIYCMTNVIKQVDRSAWRLEGPIEQTFGKLESRPEVFVLCGNNSHLTRPRSKTA